VGRLVAALLGAGVVLCACESTEQPGASPAGPTPATTDGSRPWRVPTAGGELRDANELQAALFGYADTYISLTSEAADKLVDASATPQRRVEAIRAKLDGAQDVVKIVTGPNPTVALMDLAVMVTVQRQVWDEYWAKEVFTDARAESYTAAMKRLDREI